MISFLSMLNLLIDKIFIYSLQFRKLLYKFIIFNYKINLYMLTKYVEDI